MSGYADLSRAAYISPNDLMASTQVNYEPEKLRLANQNALLTNQHNQQQIGGADTEMAARIAQSLVATGDEAKAAQMYPGMIAEAQGRGFLRHLGSSPVWPGMEKARVVAALGTSSEKLGERQANQAGWGQIYGDGTTVPGTTTSSVTASPAQPRPMQTTTTEPETGLPVLNRAAPAAPPGAGTTLADIHPNLTTIRSPNGAKLTVSADAAPRFQGLIDDLHAAGYTLDPATTGGYNARNIAGTNTPSQHAYGSAIDINWRLNARGANTPSDIPPDLARRLAAKHGLTWGGDWTGDTRDPMHFEVARGGPQAPTGGVAARTGGTDVAGPGAGPTAPQGTTQGGGGGMLAGLTPDQQKVVAGMRAAGVPFANAMTQIQHFKEQNAAAAQQAQTNLRLERGEQRAERGEVATAAHQAAQLQLSRESGQRAAEEWKAKQEAAASAVNRPFESKGDEADLRNYLVDPRNDPKSRAYHAAYSAYADTKDVNGTIIKRNMTAFQLPQDADGNPVTTYDQSHISIGPGDLSQMRKIETESGTLIAALDDFVKVSKDASTAERMKTVAGISTDLRSAWTNAALMAKGEALFNLGVLSGPDMTVIRGALADPSTFMGATASQDTIEKQANRIKTLLRTRLDQAHRSYGRGAAGAEPTAPASLTAPTTGGDVAVVKSDADFHALPSGTVFTGPDGKQRRKP